jgi:hypothetical protein
MSDNQSRDAKKAAGDRKTDTRIRDTHQTRKRLCRREH